MAGVKLTELKTWRQETVWRCILVVEAAAVVDVVEWGGCCGGGDGATDCCCWRWWLQGRRMRSKSCSPSLVMWPWRLLSEVEIFWWCHLAFPDRAEHTGASSRTACRPSAEQHWSSSRVLDLGQCRGVRYLPAQQQSAFVFLTSWPDEIRTCSRTWTTQIWESFLTIQWQYGETLLWPWEGYLPQRLGPWADHGGTGMLCSPALGVPVQLQFAPVQSCHPWESSWQTRQRVCCCPSLQVPLLQHHCQTSWRRIWSGSRHEECSYRQKQPEVEGV